jgi:hypothetical protein
MANSVNIQTILDGPRNVVVKVEGILDTSDQASMTLVDPALLANMDSQNQVKAKHLRLYTLHYIVEDGLEVRLAWDATTPVRIAQLTGRGRECYKHFDGLPDPVAAGSTGKVLLSTEGWSGVKSFTLVV